MEETIKTFLDGPSISDDFQYLWLETNDATPEFISFPTFLPDILQIRVTHLFKADLRG